MGNRLKEVLKRERVTAYRPSKDLWIDQGELSSLFKRKQNISLAGLEQIAVYQGYDLTLIKRKKSRKGGSRNGDHLQAKKDLLDKVSPKRKVLL